MNFENYSFVIYPASQSRIKVFINKLEQGLNIGIPFFRMFNIILWASSCQTKTFRRAINQSSEIELTNLLYSSLLRVLVLLVLRSYFLWFNKRFPVFKNVTGQTYGRNH